MSRRETYTQAEYDLLSELHDNMFEDRKDIEKYVICVPKRYKVFFVLIFVVMSFNLTMLYIHSTITVKEIVIFMMMIVPSALGFWNSIAWRITVYTNRDYFTTRSFFLVKRIVHYRDCLYFRKSYDKLLIKKNKGVSISIPFKSKNFFYMLSALKKNGVKDINSHYGKGGRFVVKAKKSWLALPVSVGVLLLTVLIYYFTFYKGEKNVIFTTVTGTILIVILTLGILKYAVSQVIVLKQNHFFVYKTMFGKIYEIDYAECKSSKRKGEFLVIKTKSVNYQR